MIILGLTHPISWNNAACLLVDGKLQAMVEEERFTRIKHAPRVFPSQSMKYCLREVGAALSDVDVVTVGFDRPGRVGIDYLRNDGLRTGIREGVDWVRRTARYERLLKKEVERLDVTHVKHHMAHAASAFFASHFERANVISLDGSGGSDSGYLAVGEGDVLTPLARIPNADSWGIMYERVTGLLGFLRHSGEGKTMGLAAYGQGTADDFPFIDWSHELPHIDVKTMNRFLGAIKQRGPDDSLDQRHANLAASLQAALERVAQRYVAWLFERTAIRNVCLAGGVALNCSMNGMIRNMAECDDIFVQPASHDAGTALGGALYAHASLTGKRPDFVMNHVYWGPEFTNDEVAAALLRHGIQGVTKASDIPKAVARLLVQGKTVGWFQGRAEVGPRALGARSILGDPSLPWMKDHLNLVVKGRESWRPFAPALPAELAANVLTDGRPAPFMCVASRVLPGMSHSLPAAVHVDGTCRPQTVDRQTNPRFWELLQEFYALTGTPAVLNTSFNRDSEPIVCTPDDAISTFERSGLDILAIEDFIVERRHLP